MISFRQTSIRTRLVLWYVVLLAAVLAAFGAGVYVLMRHRMYDNLNESVEERALSLAAAVQYEEGRPFLASDGRQDDDHFVRVLDADGLVRTDGTAAMGGVPIDDDALDRALAGEASTRSTRSGGGDAVRVSTVPLRHGGDIAGVLQTGQTEDDVAGALAALLLVMGIAYPVTLGVASFGGIFLARRALSPVDKITNMARQLSAEDLTQRLDLPLPNDEIGRLAGTFDDMIARLDEAFRRQRQFTADASHELRTPLAIMKGQIEVSLQQDRDPAAYRQVLQATNEAVDRLIRMVGSLLTLTRADAGEISLTFDDVDLASVVDGVVEQVSTTTEGRSLTVRSEGGPPATIRADEDLVLHLLLNLLDNATKHTEAGGRVTVRWSAADGWVALSVEDTGSGISPEHLPHLFERFYRVDSARSRADGGVGLGLAICKWVVEAHGGSIRVESVVGEGSSFMVRLPVKA